MDDDATTARNQKTQGCHQNLTISKILIITVSSLIIILMALLLTLNYILENPNLNICLTPICIAESNKLLSSINADADPCDDFHEFVCGRFIEKERIPDCESSIGRLDVIENERIDQIYSILNTQQHDDNDEIRPFRLVRDMYAACMNVDAIEARGLTMIKNVIGEELNGWPVMCGLNWIETSDFDWKRMIYAFRRLGFDSDGLIQSTIDIDPYNSTKYTIILDQPVLGLNRKFFIKGKNHRLVKAYYNYMVDVAVLFGANLTNAQQEMDDVLEFEINLAKISLSPENRRDPNRLNNLMTIAELQNNFTSIPWREYLENVIRINAITMHENNTVIVRAPSYLNKLETLLAQSPRRTQANYLLWRMIKLHAGYLNDDILNRRLNYVTAQSGRKERRPRWKECIYAITNLELAVAALFVREHVDDSLRQHAKQIVREMRAEFHQNLQQSTWMDPKTRDAALEKLAAMVDHVGYPDELLNDEMLIEHYQDLKVDVDDYFGSVMNVSLFLTNRAFGKLGQVVNKTDWREHGDVYLVDSFYNFEENNVPAGILQQDRFNHDRPAYITFGTIGPIIGHEITHGFDDRGRRFDKNGQLRDWWSRNASNTFTARSQCFVNQYSNYIVSKIQTKVDGVNTQGENIADNGGVKVAYLAYRKWTEHFGVEKSLPGLKYTPNQLFWISTASVWCSKERYNELRTIVETDTHAYAKFRVIGSVSNSESFAKDFSCPKGSKMNPERKCNIW